MSMDNASGEKMFRFVWRDGKTSEGPGAGSGIQGASDAINRLGYGQGALAALDYWEEIPEKEDATCHTR